MLHIGGGWGESPLLCKVFWVPRKALYKCKILFIIIKDAEGKGDEWPSLSPDLTPIEHLWGILKRKVEERKVSNIHQLRDVIMEEEKTPGATWPAV